MDEGAHTPDSKDFFYLKPMAQDPAFLFYYKDILVSCTDWDADEVGWYVRLLCHQADKPEGLVAGNIEDLAALAGVKYSKYQQFITSWEKRLKFKFETNEKGLLVNPKQAKTLEDRLQFKENQAEKGLFGYYIKLAKKEFLALNIPWETLEAPFRKFLHDNISTNNEKEVNQAIFKQTLEKIKQNPESWTISIIGNGNGDVIGNGNGNNNLGKGGMEGKPFNEKLLCPQMIGIYKKTNPHGPIPDDLRDFISVQTIGSYIFKNLQGMDGHYLDNQRKICDEWELITQWIAKDTFYSQKSLKTISNHISEIFNKTHNGDKSKQKYSKNFQQSDQSNSIDREKVKQELSERIRKREQNGS